MKIKNFMKAQGLILLTAFFTLALFILALNPLIAKADNGNNGTVKIHDVSAGIDLPDNDPHVCTFYIAFYFADPSQSGTWEILSWQPTGNGSQVESGTYNTSPSGFYKTQDYSLSNGHYRLNWEGSNEQNVKHKEFWVECPNPSPSSSPTCSPTSTPTPHYYYTCNEDRQCIKHEGIKQSNCEVDQDCQTEAYYDSCNNDYQCVKFPGVGESNCETNQDCQPEETTSPIPTSTPTPVPTSTPGGGGSNGGGGGGSSNPPVCSDQKPGAPTNVTAVSGPGAGQVTLTWAAPSGPVTDYSISYSDDPGTKKWGVSSTGNVTSYTISGLSVTKYYFWVNAVNGCMPGDAVGPVTVGGTGGPTQAVLGASTGPGVLGLSYTAGDTNNLFALQIFASLILSITGFALFKKNA